MGTMSRLRGHTSRVSFPVNIPANTTIQEIPMSIRRVLNLLAPKRMDRRRRAHGPRLGFESLEVRQLLTFNLAVNYAVATGPQDVVTADFNGDGRQDIATANNGSHNVSILLGNANGTFQPAQNSSTGANPLSIAVGDFNEDGKLDVATANVGDVSVLLSNGNGTFQAPVSLGFSDGSSPSSVAVWGLQWRRKT